MLIRDCTIPKRPALLIFCCVLFITFNTLTADATPEFDRATLNVHRVLSTTPVDKALQNKRICGAKMNLIPSGPFLFGPHRVRVLIDYDYCVDQYEVTVDEFQACVAAGACKGHQDWELCKKLNKDRSPNQCFSNRGDYPANYIDWYRADAYCRWAGKRLPTSKEWEKATRGVNGAAYPWGNASLICDRAHQGRGQIFKACRGYRDLPNRPVAVGSYPLGKSPYGLFDTMGNVKEWVDNRADRSIPMPEDVFALSRGSSYREGAHLIHATSADKKLAPTLSSQGHGMRCVSGLKQSTP